jgi:hypothetical protein
MKKLLSAVLISGFVTAALAQEQAAPFGLHMGMKQSELSVEKEGKKPGMFRLKTVPKPHRSFDWYVVQVGPKSGLCWIKAVGNDVKTSVYGSELKTELDSLRTGLGEVYGKSKFFDKLLSGSIWNEPNDWTMGLLKGERIYLSSWSVEEGSTLKPGLNKILLAANATSRNTGYVSLEYYFDNYSACEKEIATEGSKVF